MIFSVSLYRDQRKMAEAKVRLLSQDNPLRDKYIAWIAELIQRETNSESNVISPNLAEKESPVSGSARSAGATGPTVAASRQTVSRTAPRRMSPSVVEETCRRLRSENRLLRQMLARFGE